MKQIKLLLFFGLILFGLVFACGCTNTDSAETKYDSELKETGGYMSDEEVEAEYQRILENISKPRYSTGDVVAKDEFGYMIILAVNDDTYTIRWTTQDAGESMPGHFEVPNPAKDYSFEAVHAVATGIYKQVDVSEIDEKNTAYVEQHYSEVIAESEAEAATAAAALENSEGALSGTYFEVSASHIWDATIAFDSITSSKTGRGLTKIAVPEGTEFAQCILRLDFNDQYYSGSDYDSGWVRVSLYGPNRQLLEEGSSDVGLSSYLHVTHSF